jgi:hypothetical protein
MRKVEVIDKEYAIPSMWLCPVWIYKVRIEGHDNPWAIVANLEEEIREAIECIENEEGLDGVQRSHPVLIVWCES